MYIIILGFLLVTSSGLMRSLPEVQYWSGVALLVFLIPVFWTLLQMLWAFLKWFWNGLPTILGGIFAFLNWFWIAIPGWFGVTRVVEEESVGRPTRVIYCGHNALRTESIDGQETNQKYWPRWGVFNFLLRLTVVVGWLVSVFIVIPAVGYLVYTEGASSIYRNVSGSAPPAMRCYPILHHVTVGCVAQRYAAKTFGNHDAVRYGDFAALEKVLGNAKTAFGVKVDWSQVYRGCEARWMPWFPAAEVPDNTACKSAARAVRDHEWYRIYKENAVNNPLMMPSERWFLVDPWQELVGRDDPAFKRAVRDSKGRDNAFRLKHCPKVNSEVIFDAILAFSICGEIFPTGPS